MKNSRLPAQICNAVRSFVGLAALVVAGSTSAALAAAQAQSAAPSLTDLIHQADTQRLYLLRPWQRLGHYKLLGDGRFHSEADGADFFLAPTGKVDPQAELKATLRALFQAPKKSGKAAHPLCRFPARAAWLSTMLPLRAAGLPKVRCPKLERWLTALSPGRATLVFASSYLNSPASMYGHTFLRIEHQGDSAPSDLLAYSLSYAAVPWTKFAPLYALLGLTGGFPGRFSSTPFYLQVQTYSEVEHRDLWEYHLNLRPAQVRQLVLHAWELGQTYFDYYFLDENCSYHLLALLEVADPSLRLTEGFSLYTVPLDTVRALRRIPGLIESVHLRPSHVAKMQARRVALSSEERRLALALLKAEPASRGHLLASLKPKRKVAVLDAAQDLFAYRRGLSDHFAEQAPSPKVQASAQQFQSLVAERAKIPLRSAPLKLKRPLDPDQGHPPGRLLFGGSFLEGGPRLLAELRPAYHDPLDPQAGYDRDTSLAFFDTRLALDASGDAPHLLPDMDLIRIDSMSPLGAWVRMPSWRIRWRVGVPWGWGCRSLNCTEIGLAGGPGLGLREQRLGKSLTAIANLDLDLALMPFARIGSEPGPRPLGRVSLGAELRLILEPSAGVRTVASIQSRLNLLALARGRLEPAGGGSAPLHLRLSIDQSLPLAHDRGLRLWLHLLDGHPELGLALLQYF